MEEDAQAAGEKFVQAMRSQERAKARASEFKNRERSLEKAGHIKNSIDVNGTHLKLWLELKL